MSVPRAADSLQHKTTTTSVQSVFVLDALAGRGIP
jgi:hypothetical protein